jgi:hypothetical protein
MATKPKRKISKPFKPDELTWCELDVIGTFLVERKDLFRDHIKQFGYSEYEALIMQRDIANRIWNKMLNIDPKTFSKPLFRHLLASMTASKPSSVTMRPSNSPPDSKTPSLVSGASSTRPSPFTHAPKLYSALLTKE